MTKKEYVTWKALVAISTNDVSIAIRCLQEIVLQTQGSMCTKISVVFNKVMCKSPYPFGMIASPK